MLAAAAGVMGQLAGQSEMAEIRAYLARIDIKLDDVLNAQNDAELAKILGASRDIKSAMSLLESQGHLDVTTWETVRARQESISNAQEWALRRLGTIAEKLEDPGKMKVLAKAAESVARELQSLHVVLAHSLDLEEAYDVLRLSRVEDVTPELLVGQRLELKAKREERRTLVQAKHGELIARMVAAADRANSQALLHRPSLRTVVNSVNAVGTAIDDFHKPLGLEHAFVPLEETRLLEAARSPQQLKTASAEVGINAGKAVAVAAALGVVALATKKFGGGGHSGSA